MFRSGLGTIVQRSRTSAAKSTFGLLGNRLMKCVMIAFALIGQVRALGFDVVYVNRAAVGANDGTSWSDAFTDLQDALAEAIPGDDIWVAKGSYRPAGPGSSRDATFRLRNDVALYGGFAGSETSLNERDIAMNETILSGDLNGDDVGITPASDCCSAHSGPGCDDAACAIEICAAIPECCTSAWSSICANSAGLVCGNCETTGSLSDNSFNVVTGADVSLTARVDGFTISSGYADRGYDFHYMGTGGGLRNDY